MFISIRLAVAAWVGLLIDRAVVAFCPGNLELELFAEVLWNREGVKGG